MIAPNTDYVGEGLGRLPEQYSNAPRMKALLTAYLTQCQDLEDQMYAVWADRVLGSGLAFGDLLDKLGKIVGQPRLGATDAVYSNYISARIATNRSTGKREELIKIAELLMPNLVIYVKDYFPAAIEIFPEGNFDADPTIVALQFLGEAIAAGVRLMFIYTSVPLATTLLCEDSSGGFIPTTAQDLSDSSGNWAGGNIASVVTV